MDLLYYEQPIFILIPLILLFWLLLVYFLKKKIHLSSLADLILNSIGIVAHAVAIVIVFMNNGTLSDVLLLVLLSATLSLLLSPKANKTDKEEEN